MRRSKEADIFMQQFKQKESLEVVMRCKEVMEILERHSPAELAESWDNVGLLTGRADKEVQKIMVALDAGDSVIEQAARWKADMLITHHPLIFKALKSITDKEFIGNRLIQLIQSDISYYAMHTNFDVRGMADLSAEYLKLTDREVLNLTAVLRDGSREGIGRVGNLPRAMKLAELAEYVKECFSLKDVRICGDFEREIYRAAVSAGSGKDMIEHAVHAKAEVLITGDIDYHTAIDARAQGLSIIDAGHFGTEIIFSEYIKQYLERLCPDLQIMEAKEDSPFMIL